VLLKQFRNGTQRFVHLLSGSEFACDIGFQNNHISAFGVSCGVLASYAFAEVIFWTHRILLPS
jgi:hypothetical protein